jgi:outer membrane protein assembly factor BamB
MSAVAVAGKYAVTMWNADNQQLLVALDARTGQTSWTTAIGPQYENSMGDGPRATPTIAGDIVYAYSGEGLLVAADLDSGELLWQVKAVDDSRAMPSDYGMSSSPLVVADRVIVHTGGSDSTVSAYDAKSGTRVWAAGSGPAGYSSPTLLEIDGVNQVVSFVGSGVLGLAPTDGKVLWSYPFKTPYDCNTATPIVVDGGIFISAGENHGCALLDVRKQGNNYKVAEKWKSVETKSVMRNEWQTSVLLDGFLYGFDNVGSAGPTTHLGCIRASTGERVWQESRFGKGNLTLADGKLWITTMDGELALAKASPDGYQELGRMKLFGKTRQSLSIAGGRGFIRDDNEVVCLKLAK